MSELAEQFVTAFVVTFCRIGSCVMVMPGLSAPRVPMSVRLYIALAISLVTMPLVEPYITAIGAWRSLVVLLPLMAGEIIVGLLIGLMARCFFLALQFFSGAASAFMGYSGAFAPPITEDEPDAPFTNLVMLTAAVLVVAADMHWLLISALIDSYRIMPPDAIPDPAARLALFLDVLARAFLLGLQVASPFLLYSVIVNAIFGVIGKLIPQIPVFFVSMPFLLAGGLFLAFLIISEYLRVFLAEYDAWLRLG